jgi:tRNA(Ile)-lysidine synthase
MDALINRVRDCIIRHGMIGKNDRVLLSLSAGKDSMFLFNACSRLKEELSFEFGVFHLNHMVRGPDADEDERSVVTLAGSSGVEILVERYDFSGQAIAGVSFEEHARDVRYRMLHEIASARGYNRIATAHTRDDSIETILMRFFTGTGIHGLKGIPPKRGMIIRPLIDITAREIYDYLAANRIAWREDASNADPTYARNFIRNEILPLVRKRFPMVDSAVSSLGEVSAESSQLLDALLDAAYPGLLERYDGHVFIDAGRVMNSRPAFNHIVATVVRDYFGVTVNRSILRELYDGFGTGSANANLFSNNSINAEKLFRGGKSVLKLTRASSVPLSPGEWELRIDLAGGPEQVVWLDEIGIRVVVKLCDYEYYQKNAKNEQSVFVTMENDENTIYIRNRRNGDRVSTECGTKKLKDLFIEKKLSNVEKDRVPILVIGSRIAAVMAGLVNETSSRVSSDFLVDKNSKKVISVSALKIDG